MNAVARPVNRHDVYHAHIYFDEHTLVLATTLCHRLAQRFGLAAGPIYQRPIGPHPKGSCQVVFTRAQFTTLIPWLDQHRKGLTLFIHGLSGDGLKDHTDYAYWLGEAVELNLSLFSSKRK